MPAFAGHDNLTPTIGAPDVRLFLLCQMLHDTVNHVVDRIELGVVLAARLSANLKAGHGRVGSRAVLSDDAHTNRREPGAVRQQIDRQSSRACTFNFHATQWLVRKAG
jgi:hypothetical protein